MTDSNVNKSKGMDSQRARDVRQAGHDAETEFAGLIGGKVYSSGGGRKKDVIDKNNDIHSVKSGELKWQIFLYALTRFQNDLHFQGAEFFIKCIESFPVLRSEYLQDKVKYKIALQLAMLNLKAFLEEGRNKRIFIDTAFLNNAEVDYITIKNGGNFHVFNAKEALDLINQKTTLATSKARRETEMDDQKVVFKLENDLTIGEIEMRNDSDAHYRQVKFWISNPLLSNLLIDNLGPGRQKYPRVFAYGVAARRFS